MADIFINYRRDDAPGVAGRLFDYLASRYSRGQLFMDVDAMEPGIDFAKQLEVQVSQCHAVIAVIGPHWLDARDQAGHRRLDSDNDYVRVELASALRRDIPVIPVLVDGAVMPAEDRLPDDLKPLARRHALELRHTRFNSDADTIMRALEKMVPRGHVPWRYIGSGAALVVIVVLGMLWPIFNAKLHPPAPMAVKPEPPPLNPMVATTPPVAPAPAPPAASINCKEEGTLRSLEANVETSIVFTNKENRPVHVYWLDYDGKRILYDTLGTGQVSSIQTYVTHPWLITDAKDNCKAIYMPTSKRLEVSVDD